MNTIIVEKCNWHLAGKTEILQCFKCVGNDAHACVRLCTIIILVITETSLWYDISQAKC